MICNHELLFRKISFDFYYQLKPKHIANFKIKYYLDLFALSLNIYY